MIQYKKNKRYGKRGRGERGKRRTLCVELRARAPFLNWWECPECGGFIS